MENEKVPVYIQIRDQLRDEIEAGRWKIGDKLPSERDLANYFSVSRMTLRQAVQTLVDEGIIDRKVGSGTYISKQKVQEKMSGVTSFSEIIRSQGKEPSSRTISYYIATPSKGEKKNLELLDQQKVLRMERVRYADEVPICFEIASIPYDLVKEYTKEEITHSFYDTLLLKGNLQPGRAIQTISAMLASEKVASYLEIKKGAAILRLQQTSYLTNHQPFEYVRSSYVGNRFEFFLEK